MITHIAGVELSRQHALMMLNADREARLEAQAAQAAREERAERAQADLQRYFQEHGEYPYETVARQQAGLARAEALAERRAAVERAERQQAQMAQLMMAGRQPRTIQEILAIAAMMP